MTVDGDLVTSVIWEITEIPDPMRLITSTSPLTYVDISGTTAVKKTYTVNLNAATCAAYVNESVSISGGTFTGYDADGNVITSGTIDEIIVQIGGRPADDPQDPLGNVILIAKGEGEFSSPVSFDFLVNPNNHVICLDLPPTSFSNGEDSITLKMTRVFA